jgi:hypothetical protein
MVGVCIKKPETFLTFPHLRKCRKVGKSGKLAHFGKCDKVGVPSRQVEIAHGSRDVVSYPASIAWDGGPSRAEFENSLLASSLEQNSKLGHASVSSTAYSDYSLTLRLKHLLKFHYSKDITRN